jgi:hypothetical protein
MQKANWMALSAIGMLLSAEGFADDAKSSDTVSEPLPVVTLSAETLLAEPAHASGWQVFQPSEAMDYSHDWPRPIADIDFQNTSAMDRVSKVRNLSLVTLAEIRQTRLFLGVNEDGLVGLHFDAFPHYGHERYLEVVRMPYLKKNEPDGEVD